MNTAKKITLLCWTWFLLLMFYSVSPAAPVSKTVNYTAKADLFDSIDKDIRIPDYDPFHLYLNFFLSPGTVTADLTGEVVFDQKNQTITMRGQDGNFYANAGMTFTGSMEMDFTIPGKFFEEFFGLSEVNILNLIVNFKDIKVEELVPLFEYGKEWKNATDFRSLLLSGNSVQMRVESSDILSKRFTTADLAGIIATAALGIPPVAVKIGKKIIQIGLGTSGIRINAGLASDLTLSGKSLTVNGKQISQEGQNISAPGLDLSQNNYSVNTEYIGNLGATLDLLLRADYEFMFNPLGILIWEYDEPFAELPISIIPQFHTDIVFDSSPATIRFPIADQAPAVQPPEAVTGNLHTLMLAENGASWPVNVAPYFLSANPLRYRVTSQNNSIARASPTGGQSGSLWTIQPRNAGSTTVVITAQDPTNGLTATQTIAVTVEGTPTDYTDISQPITGVDEQPMKPLHHGAEVVLILEKPTDVRHIRKNPGLNEEFIEGHVNDRATGIIKNGPEFEDGHTWYEVEWHHLEKWYNPWWISAYYKSGAQVLFHNAPDLEIYDFDVDDNTVKPGGTLTLEAEIENNGPGDSDPTKIFFYYSTERHENLDELNDSMNQGKLKSANIEGNGAVEVPSIRVGRSKTIKITVDAPLTPHIDYYYGAIVTPEPIVVTKTQALNNFTTRDRPHNAQEENVEITSDPDFVVPSISADKVTVDPGERFELEVTVKNQGLGTPRDNPRLDYYRSSNETITDNDNKVGSNSVSKLDTGEMENASIRLTAPKTPGVYYYGACVDLRYESKTDNNCSPAVAITVQDPAPSQEPDPPDLIVKSFNVSATTLNPGEPFTLNATVTNQGNSYADTITLRYYRSSNTSISSSDAEVGSIDISSLNTQESEQRNLSLIAPLASGTYHYGACVDGLPTENDTQNNCSAGVAITVKNLAPVATDTLLPTPTLLANGTSVTIDLHPYFSDPNGDDISYQAWTDNTKIVAVHLFGGSESLLTINPLEEAGVATVVVEAKDAQSLEWSARQDITVTVTPPSSITSVCDRTPEIRDALTRISRVADCNDITSVHLDALTTLVLTAEGITTLKEDDFDGLSNLTVLNLSENLLAGLNTSVLNPLVNLRQLDVSRNQLAFLTEGAFNVHSGLETLDLSNNQLAYIPPGIFGALANLTKLNLAGNDLTQLPPGIFAGLNSLTELDVRENRGAPFILSPTPVHTDTPDRAAVAPASIAVYVAEGAPFDIDVSLTAEGGMLSETTVTIAKGETHSQTITVTPMDTGAVTVIPSVSAVPLAYYGIQTSPGDPLVLFDTGANQAPVAVAHIPAQMLIAGSAAVTIDVSGYFNDPDDDVLTYTASSNNTDIAITGTSDSTVTITPVAVGSAMITVTAIDGTLTATQTVSVSVLANSDEAAWMPDANLRSAVRAELGLNEENTLTQQAMQGLTVFMAQSKQIKNLAGLEQATRLTKLVLGYNQISDISALEGLTALTWLDLENNQISDISALEGLTALTYLNLYGNQISNIDALKNLTKLTSLSLYNNYRISDISALEGLTALTELQLQNNQIVDITPLANLIDLKTLFSHGNQIVNINSLGDLTALTRLTLHQNKISDISVLKNLTALMHLDLRWNQIAALPTGFFTGFSNLSTLILTENSGAPFTLTLELARTDTTDLTTPGPATVKVKVDEGAPFDISVTLSVSGGTPSPATATIVKGSTESSAITVTQIGQGATTVSLRAVPTVPVSNTFTGIQTAAGSPITLFNSTPINRAPVTVGTIPAQVLTVDGTAAKVNVSSYFSDPDGDTLTYTASSNNTVIATVNMSGTTVTIAPIAAGSATITITANDSSLKITQTFTATVNADLAEETWMPDANLRAAVRTALGLDEDEALTQRRLQELTRLEESWYSEIRNLAGLEYATNLNSLNLNGNHISDITPLRDLTALTYLSLSGNQISDITALKDLTVLTTLWISQNKISDISSLENLTALTALSLNQNKISDISSLENLTALTNLYLEGNKISDISSLENLTALTILYLDDNQVIDISALEDLTALATLENNRNQVSDITPLADLTALVRLELGSNQISDISSLEDLTKLTTLNLGFNQIEDISAIEDLTNLKSLSLYNNQIIDISALEDLTALTYLNLRANQISDVSALEDLTALKTLKLSGNSIKDYGPLRRLKAKNPNIAVDITIPDEDPDNAPAAPLISTTTVLLSNYPNPFNPETWIPYQLSKPAKITLTIYNMRGIMIRQLTLGYRPAGVYHSRSRAAYWDGKNVYGEPVASGVYFYVFSAGDFKATRKMFLRK